MRRKLWLAATAVAAAAAVVITRSASAATIDRQCAIGDVSVFADRVHLLCTPPPQPDSAFAYSGALGRQVYAVPYTALPYFATETSGLLADKVVAVAIAALQTGRILAMTYDNDPAHNPAGCGTGDCRRVVALRLLK